MDENKLKTIIEEALDKAVKSMQEGLNEVKQGLNGVKEDVNGLHEDFNGMKQDQVELRGTIAEMKKTIEERILPPLVYIETTVKSYADQYVINEDHIGRLDKRLSTVEENLGIQPPQELAIPPIN